MIQLTYTGLMYSSMLFRSTPALCVVTSSTWPGVSLCGPTETGLSADVELENADDPEVVHSEAGEYDIDDAVAHDSSLAEMLSPSQFLQRIQNIISCVIEH